MASPKPDRAKRQVHEPEPPSPESAGTRLSAHEIYENVSAAAEEELERPAPALLWSATAAGLTIGNIVGGVLLVAPLNHGRVVLSSPAKKARGAA